jgi:hypothetical protein
MVVAKPIKVKTVVQKYDQVLFGSGVSKPYTPYTLLTNVTVTTKDTRKSGSVTFQITGTLPDGKVTNAEGYAYKKGNSPWKFSCNGLVPLEYSSGMVSHCECLSQFLFGLGEYESPRPYRTPTILIDDNVWVKNTIWQEW